MQEPPPSEAGSPELRPLGAGGPEASLGGADSDEPGSGLERDLRRLAKSSIDVGVNHPRQKKAKQRVAQALFGEDSSDDGGEAEVDPERSTGNGELDFDHIHRYQVQSMIGAGAMGRVYRAFDPQLARTLAIKVLHPDYSDEERARARIVREAQALARLSHPNVIQVYDVGDSRAGFFIAMEWVLGKTLREHVRESPADQWRRIFHYFLDAGEGLAAAHQAGLVHRDFKPENVIVGKSGRVRVLDFGLARPSGPLAHLDEPVEGAEGEHKGEPGDAVAAHRWMGLTQTGALLGTPIYMAPELYRGGSADARSDQFAYCVALFDALYRQRPFEGKNVESYAEAVASGRLVSPDPGEIPLPLLAVLERGLSTEPEHRFENMRALLVELRKAVDTPRILRRRKRVAWAAALLLFGGVGAYSVYQEPNSWLAHAMDRKLVMGPGGGPGLVVPGGQSNGPMKGDGNGPSPNPNPDPSPNPSPNPSPDESASGALGGAGANNRGEKAEGPGLGDKLDKDRATSGDRPAGVSGQGPKPAPNFGGDGPASAKNKADPAGKPPAKNHAAPRRKQKLKSNKSVARKSDWCSLHEDSYRLLRREKRRQNHFKARGGRCFVCRIEARASRTRQFSPGDCQGYQLCGPTDAAKCE